MRAWRSGRVALVNAPGAGIADDKKVYSYVPDIIRFFLDEEPILAPCPPSGAATRTPATTCWATWSDLVVKPANESGGYGVLVGTQATEDELAAVAKQIEDDPKRWVAQPIIPLSTAPTLCDGEIAPRHVDLRPFTLLGPDGAYVTRGGLTRVARTRRAPWWSTRPRAAAARTPGWSTPVEPPRSTRPGPSTTSADPGPSATPGPTTGPLQTRSRARP